MSTPVGITITSTQGDFVLEVSMNAESGGYVGGIAATQLERASRAMAILLDSSRPSNDDDDENVDDYRRA